MTDPIPAISDIAHAWLTDALSRIKAGEHVVVTSIEQLAGAEAANLGQRVSAAAAYLPRWAIYAGLALDLASIYPWLKLFGAL